MLRKACVRPHETCKLSRRWLRRRSKSLWISTFRASIRTSRVAGADVGADVVGKNLLHENKFQFVFLPFLHTNPKGSVFRSFVNSEFCFLKTTFLKTSTVIFVKGNRRRKSTNAKAVLFSPPTKSYFQVSVLWTVDQQMESKFVSVPSCFKVPKINMKQKTTSCKKQLRSFLVFSPFSESFQWRVADFTLFSSSAFRAFLTLGMSFFSLVCPTVAG